MAASVRSAAVRGITLLLFLLLSFTGHSLASDALSTPAADPRISILSEQGGGEIVEKGLSRLI
ncbi:hypothetical protein AB9F35_35855, partial [Rhizobium leguminosarum]|uniref:hypothetical protein n=1 Tax=Rhizobium leguminosarum TaxID=384 RepID=UPI003F9591B9